MTVRPYRHEDQAAVIELWRACELTRPWNDPVKDIARKLKVNGEWFLVGEIDGKIVATMMVGYEGHRGWVNYLAVSAEHRRKGLGSQLMSEAERILRGVGCPKINLQIRAGNDDVVEFYRQIGYAPDQTIGMGKRLERDDPKSES
jgi:ribosomal protein S18 acetylase RimI-like enzyme